MSADDRAKYERQMRTVWAILFSSAAIFWICILWFRSTSYDDFCYRVGSSILTGLFSVAAIGVISGIGYIVSKLRGK